KTFRSQPARQAASSTSSSVPPGMAPALLTTISTSGKAARTRSRAPASARSAPSVRAVTPLASAIASASAFSFSAERATMQTLTPSRASHCAAASPMPLEAPVTSAVRPESFRSMDYSRSHMRRQVERQNWKGDQDHEANEIGDDERQHAGEDRREADVLHDAFDHEHVHADRRMDEAELHRHDDDDAEPDRIEAELADHREDDRDGENDHRQRIHQAAEHDVHHHDQRQHAVTAEPEAGQKRGDRLRRL